MKIATKYSIKAGVSALLALSLAASPARLALAEDYASQDFIVTDSVITMSGGESSSLSFKYFSSDGQVSGSEASSAGFTAHSGEQYYPVASTPIVSATAGDGQVNLAWTETVGTLANVTSYSVGIATASDGPYSYVSVGNVTGYTASSLANGTAYYFRIKAYAGSLPLAESAAVSATPVATAIPPTSGGGGGGAVPAKTQTSGAAINFTGRAYPNSAIVLLKDAQVAVRTIAGPDAIFSINLSGISAGSYNFSIYGEDNSGRRSALITVPIALTDGATTNVSGIFIAPTIAVDKSEVKKGDTLAIFGQASNNSDIVISVHSDEEIFLQTKADKDGVYLYNFDTSPLALGQHATKSKVAKDGSISPYGQAISFTVGSKNVTVDNSVKILKGDLNADSRVNLVDFSIGAYWYKRNLNESFKKIECSALNCDSKIDLVDFSIMAYYWTG